MNPTFSQTTPPFSQSYVSSQNLRDYTTNLIATYNKTINDYFPDLKNSFRFYSSAYNVTTCQSSQGGVGISFEPANITSFSSYNSSATLNLMLFGGYDEVSNAAIEVGNGTNMFTNGLISNFNVIQIMGTGTLILINLTVRYEGYFTEHYSYVIIKGSNVTDSWSLDRAKSDAEELLYNDMHIEFSTSEDVKRRYAEPELTQLLQDMLKKFGDNSQVYPMYQWKSDLQNLENIAKNKYRLTDASGFINQLLNYLNSRNAAGTTPTIPTPPLTQSPEYTPTPKPERTLLGINDSGNWIYTTLIGFYVFCVYSVFIVVRYINGRIKDEEWSIMTNDVVLGSIIIGVGLPLFVANFPFDSPISILQIILAVAIPLLVVFLLLKAKRKLSFLRSSGNKNSNSTHKNPKNKAEQTAKPNPVK